MAPVARADAHVGARDEVPHEVQEQEQVCGVVDAARGLWQTADNDHRDDMASEAREATRQPLRHREI